MKVQGRGLLNHHFWGEYYASIGIVFDTEVAMEAALALLLGPWEPRGCKDGTRRGLWCMVDSAGLDAVVERLVNLGAEREAIASLAHSIDFGDPWTITVEIPDDTPPTPKPERPVLIDIVAHGKITLFRGPFMFLSNFAPAVTEYRGRWFPTAENAYQAAKTIAHLETKDPWSDAEGPSVEWFQSTDPGQAKYMGGKLSPRGWPAKQQAVMTEVVRSKFSDPELRDLLLMTRHVPIIHGNEHSDRTWGAVYKDGKWEGKNLLGTILEETRTALQAKHPDLILPCGPTKHPVRERCAFCEGLDHLRPEAYQAWVLGQPFPPATVEVSP